MKEPFAVILDYLSPHLPSLVILAACIIYVVRSRDRLGWIALVGQAGLVGLTLIAVGLLYAITTDQMSVTTYKKWREQMALGWQLFVWVFAIGCLVIAVRAKRPAQPRP